VNLPRSANNIERSQASWVIWLEVLVWFAATSPLEVLNETGSGSASASDDQFEVPAFVRGGPTMLEAWCPCLKAKPRVLINSIH
jgi:hypothetical protein